MKVILNLILCVSASYGLAQSKQLPYRNTMTTQQEKNELTVIRTGVSHLYTWNINSAGFASHDYPVGGSSTDTVSDWLFTPPIKVTTGAQLAFKYWVYGITGSATPSDEFSVWYGKNGMQPGNGTFVKILDLTNKISSQMAWKDTNGIILPSIADSGYICFRYKATNNWFTVGLDSIVVAVPGLGVKNPELTKLKVYPNPAHSIVRIESSDIVNAVVIYNSNMQSLANIPVNDYSTEIKLESMNPGYYIVKIITATSTLYRKLHIE